MHSAVVGVEKRAAWIATKCPPSPKYTSNTLPKFALSPPSSSQFLPPSTL